ncbi:hypothetical protein GCM10022291_15470 [Postechiella marina]|uniref:Methionyl-tRNA formyltransferase n=1 Tax=Postechiella marina TaxID=943941 RepID=A0ABP8C7W5_9FLAO
MKTILLGSFPSALTIYKYLLENESLDAVFVLEEYCSQEVKDILSLQFKANNVSGVFTSKLQLNIALAKYLKDNKIDVVVVFGCPTLIEKESLIIPKHGFLNIHFGKLPGNRGADPLFWTIKNQEKSTAITIHKMDANFDTGPVLLEEAVSVYFGETSGMLSSKLTLQALQVLKQSLQLLGNSENYVKQVNLDLYRQKPSRDDLTINWENQTADDIESLVNACNPKYTGAITYYQGTEVNIIEVSPASNTESMQGEVPGKIIHAHPQEGLFVCCKNGELLRINIMKTDAGVLTGTKYVTIGMQMGQQFTTKA